MEKKKIDIEPPTFWQLVFSQSRVNGGEYRGDDLPVKHWDWPKDTYLQKRLEARGVRQDS